MNDEDGNCLVIRQSTGYWLVGSEDVVENMLQDNWLGQDDVYISEHYARVAFDKLCAEREEVTRKQDKKE